MMRRTVDICAVSDCELPRVRLRREDRRGPTCPTFFTWLDRRTLASAGSANAQWDSKSKTLFLTDIRCRQTPKPPAL